MSGRLTNPQYQQWPKCWFCELFLLMHFMSKYVFVNSTTGSFTKKPTRPASMQIRLIDVISTFYPAGSSEWNSLILVAGESGSVYLEIPEVFRCHFRCHLLAEISYWRFGRMR